MLTAYWFTVGCISLINMFTLYTQCFSNICTLTGCDNSCAEDHASAQVAVFQPLNQEKQVISSRKASKYCSKYFQTV